MFFPQKTPNEVGPVRPVGPRGTNGFLRLSRVRPIWADIEGCSINRGASLLTRPLLSLSICISIKVRSVGTVGTRAKTKAVRDGLTMARPADEATL